MSEERKKKLIGLLTEAVRALKEADLSTPGVGGGGGSPVPPSPLPPAQATNAAQAAPPAVPDTGAQGAGDQKPFDLDSLIDRLNVIRGGKSFADPEVYGQLTTYFKGLSDADKSVIDRFLQSIGKVVIQVDQQQGGSAPAAQPAMNQSPGAAPPVTAAPTPGAPVTEGFTEIDELLSESLKQNVKFGINGKEFEIGSSDHVKILKGILMGLQALRDCYAIGSANRHVYSAATHKLRKHLRALTGEA